MVQDNARCRHQGRKGAEAESSRGRTDAKTFARDPDGKLFPDKAIGTVGPEPSLVGMVEQDSRGYFAKWTELAEG